MNRAVRTFMTPASTMTRIGFIFPFCSSTTQITKIPTMIQLVPQAVICALFSQKALIKMAMPAEPIRATTAGHKEASTPCNRAMFRYLRYNFAISVTMMQEGRIHPKVAARAPGTPAIFIPTKVAEFTAMGPGVIWEIVMRSVNSAMVNH